MKNNQKRSRLIQILIVGLLLASSGCKNNGEVSGNKTAETEL